MTSQQDIATNTAISDGGAPPDLDRIVRPPALVYGVDDRPPPARLALLAFHYDVITMIYLVLVGIILRHAHVTTDEGLRVLTIACVGLAIGTILQALRFGTRIKASLDWSATEDGIATARAFVRNTAITWKVPPGVAEVAGEEVSAAADVPANQRCLRRRRAPAGDE